MELLHEHLLISADRWLECHVYVQFTRSAVGLFLMLGYIFASHVEQLKCGNSLLLSNYLVLLQSWSMLIWLLNFPRILVKQF
jgi:hypothetical protein